MAYNNPKAVIAISTIFEFTMIVFVSLRFLARRKKRVTPMIADWFILAAALCATGLTVLEIYGTAVKALAEPLHTTLADQIYASERLQMSMKIEFAAVQIAILALGLIKLSISLLYYHIFATPVFRRVMIAWIVIIAIWTFTFFLFGLAECGSHLKALFGSPQSFLQNCSSAIRIGMALNGSDIATDFITLILPIPMIWRLQMPIPKKILLVCMFMIGSLSVGAGIGKAYIYIKSSLGILTEDAILTVTGFSLWNLLEVQVGIIAACAPALVPILSGLLPFLESLRTRLSSQHRSCHIEFSGGPRRLSSSEELQLSPYWKTEASVQAGPSRPGSQMTTKTCTKALDPLDFHVC